MLINLSDCLRSSIPIYEVAAELRNRIYDLALTSEKKIVLKEGIKRNRRHLAFRGQDKKLNENKEILGPNILRVSEQVYQEALPVLYNQTLEFVEASALYYFLAQFGKDAVKSIQEISFHFLSVRKRSGLTHPVSTALVHAENRNVLTVQYMRLHDSSKLFHDIKAGRAAQWFYPIAHVWIEQMERGLIKGRKVWRNVLSIAKDKKFSSFWTGGELPCEEFCEDVGRLLKE